MKKDKGYCLGCHDDFYNGKNDMNIKECWNFKKAKMVTRFRIGWWTPMDKASNFEEVKVLSCYCDLENGHGNAYLTEIPDHLKQEWKELHRTLALTQTK